MAFVTSVMVHWLEREIAQWVHPMKDRSRRPTAPWPNALPLSYIPLPKVNKSSQLGLTWLSWALVLTWVSTWVTKKCGFGLGREQVNYQPNNLTLQILWPWPSSARLTCSLSRNSSRRRQNLSETETGNKSTSLSMSSSSSSSSKYLWKLNDKSGEGRSCWFNGRSIQVCVWLCEEGRKEIFYLTMHSTHFIYGYMEGRKEMFYLTMHSTHFIYGYMSSDIW